MHCGYNLRMLFGCMEAYMHMLKPISIAIGALSLCAMPASAEGAPWCAYKSNGGTNCGFYSWEQCKANIYGNDYCAPNPSYSGTKASRRRQRD
jgi:hypothetical protein